MAAGPRRPDVISCACGKTRRIVTSGREYPPAALESYRLFGRQVLKDQGILGRYEIAERNFVKRELPEECEDPVVVNRRSAWQLNLLELPAAGIADRFADLLNQSLFGVVLEVRRYGERADRAHRYVLDAAVLAYRLVRPFSDQDTRIRNRPSLMNLFVQLLEDFLLGAVIHTSRNVDVGDRHLGLLYCMAVAAGSFGCVLISPNDR